nr:T9SS type A sorting domain-containing protein [Bacteroidota bacterium]
MKKKRILIGCLLLWQLCLKSQSTSSCAFYISPHPDDWQLFIGKNAWNDVKVDTQKVIFIHISAGDAGWLKSKYGSATTPYYLARERGARFSVEFAVNADVTSSTYSTGSSGTKIFNNKTIQWFKYRNTTNYVLRLPDGFFDGNSPRNLKKLYLSPTDTLPAVDSSALYYGWNDLAKTVQSILLFEKNIVPKVWINYPDSSEVKNLFDHSDHKYTALLINAAIDTLKGFNRRLYLNYVTGSKSANLTKNDTKIESALFAAYCMGLTNYKYKTDWADTYTKYLDRNYFTEILDTNMITTGKLQFNNAQSATSDILYSCFPNPAQAATELQFEVSNGCNVTITLYDEEGKVLQTLFNEKAEAGKHSISINTSNLPSGNYHIILNNGKTMLETTLEILH